MNDMTTKVHTPLIRAEKVIGTNVYNHAGEKLGSVEDVVLDKKTGRAVYATMAFGGFLGLGHKHHHLPWSMLKYDSVKDGYMTNLTKESLTDAPGFNDGADDFKWTSDYGRRVDSFYRSPSYWDGI